MGRLGPALTGVLAAERDRWFLWLPVALGIGIAIYFALPVEPPVWAAAAGTCGFLILAIIGRRRAAPLSGALLLATLVGGILVAHLRTIDVSADPRNGGRAGRGDRAHPRNPASGERPSVRSRSSLNRGRRTGGCARTGAHYRANGWGDVRSRRLGPALGRRLAALRAGRARSL